MNDGEHRFSWPWFIFGCVLFLVAVVAFFWAFALGDLTHDRRSLLLWILPLASGVAAGCFSGSISASGKVGLTTTATGGFAVWLLSFFLLPKPVDQLPPSFSISFDKGTSFRQGAEMIAKREGFSVDFKCPNDFLAAELSTDTLTAKGPQQVLEKLGTKVTDLSLRRKYRVLRSADNGMYEIRCE